MAGAEISQGMVSPAIFESLQTKLDEDAQVREELKNIVQSMERLDRTTTSILSRAHSIPQAHRDTARMVYCDHRLIYLSVRETLSETRASINKQVETVAKLNKVASKHPYYKYNNTWSREMQNAVRSLGTIV